MSDIFKSEFLNEYIRKTLERNKHTEEELKTGKYKLKNLMIINKDKENFVQIGAEDVKTLCNLGCNFMSFEGISFDNAEFEDISLVGLIFKRCDLSTCDFSKVQVSNGLALSDYGNKVDINSLDVLCDLSQKRTAVKFDEMVLTEKVTSEKEEEPQKLGVIKKVLHSSKDITENDGKQYDIKLELQDINVLNKLVKEGFLGENGAIDKLGINNVNLKLESLEGISEEAIQYISQNKDKRFNFVVRTLNGLNHNVLEELSENDENLNFFVEGDFEHFRDYSDWTVYDVKHISLDNLDKLVPYKLEDMKKFVNILEAVKEETQDARTDLGKFSKLRKFMLTRSDYDFSGLEASENFSKEKRYETRSLMGGLLTGRTVCGGDALGFLVLSEYVGLKTKCIYGAPKEDLNIGHAWNQVQIRDENGEPSWYHYDCTNDGERRNDDSAPILESDATFYESFIPASEEVEKCDKSIPNEEIYRASFDVVSGKEEQENQNSKVVYPGQYSGKSIDMQDIKDILKSLTLSEFNYFTNKIKHEKEKNKEEVEIMAI